MLLIRRSAVVTVFPFHCRKMMDSGQIDFYQHDKLCTNTCRSTKFDLLISSARAPVPGQSNVVQAPPTGEGMDFHSWSFLLPLKVPWTVTKWKYHAHLSICNAYCFNLRASYYGNCVRGDSGRWYYRMGNRTYCYIANE